MEALNASLTCSLLFFVLVTSGCDSPLHDASAVPHSPRIITADLRANISGKPQLSIRRYPLFSFTLDCNARTGLLNSIVNSGLVKASPGVCIHMMRLRRFISKTNKNQLAFDLIFKKYEEVLFNEETHRISNGGISILVDTPYGVRYRITPLHYEKNYELASQLGAVAHRDQVLAKLFESGRSLDFPVRTPSSRDLKGSDILIDSLASFDNRAELEWTLMAYCGYLKTPDFVNSKGDQFRLIDLGSQLFKRPAGNGSCHDCHRLYALAVFLNWANIETKNGGDSELLRTLTAEIQQHFKEVSIVLENNQCADGSWNGTWWKTVAEPGGLIDENELSNRIRATGHLLEWCAITPPDFRPDDRVIAKGVGYLSGLLLPRPDHFAEKHLLATSHALSALFLLDPLEITNEQ